MNNYLKQLNPEYMNDYQIDKDLKQWNQKYKIYGSLTCIMIPSELNSALANMHMERMVEKDLPLAVTRNGNVYSINSTLINTLHLYPYKSFYDPMEAFNYYKEIKQDYLRRLADQYISIGQITQEVHDLVYNLEILPFQNN